MANVLVVGSGGREHALAVFLARSPQVEKVITAPGNAGTSLNKAIDVTGGEHFSRLAAFAREAAIDLTVVGPEVPLCAGIVDSFEQQGLRIFGPGRAAARLEGDKAFAREFMKKYRIPHPNFALFSEPAAAKDYLSSLPEGKIVVKASGLAAGKGSVVCDSIRQALEAVENMMELKAFGPAGERVVIEEYLEGEEASILALCDGREVFFLASSQDHKRIYDGDRGPNTGGMGAYAPAPVVTEEVLKKVNERIFKPALRGMAELGSPYRGCLYAGLMISDGEPWVVEFNCRFGDPEAQAVLPLLDGDLFLLLKKAAQGNLQGAKIKNRTGAACCVVMASGGYPGGYDKGKKIEGLAELEDMENIYAFHAGTRLDGRGNVVTSGGRVLGVTAVGGSIEEAVRRTYQGVEKVSFERCYFRKDIGHRAMRRRN